MSIIGPNTLSPINISREDPIIPIISINSPNLFLCVRVPPPPFVIPTSMVFPNGQPTYVMATSPTSPPPPMSPIAGPMSPPNQAQVFFEYSPYLAGQTVFYGSTLYDQNFLPAGQVILSSPGFPPQTYIQPISPPPPPGPVPMALSTCQHAQFYLQNGEQGLTPPPGNAQPMLVNQ